MTKLKLSVLANWIHKVVFDASTRTLPSWESLSEIFAWYHWEQIPRTNLQEMYFKHSTLGFHIVCKCQFSSIPSTEKYSKFCRETLDIITIFHRGAAIGHISSKFWKMFELRNIKSQFPLEKCFDMIEDVVTNKMQNEN